MAIVAVVESEQAVFRSAVMSCDLVKPLIAWHFSVDLCSVISMVNRAHICRSIYLSIHFCLSVGWDPVRGPDVDRVPEAVTRRLSTYKFKNVAPCL